MAIQLAVSTRNAMLDSIEVDLGTSPHLKIRSGAAPADCATADSGTVLADLALPADWMAAASGGSKAMSGAWADADADATGTAQHFRIYTSGGVCKLQGTVTATSGGGDLEVQNTSFAIHQAFSITGFTLGAANP